MHGTKWSRTQNCVLKSLFMPDKQILVLDQTLIPLGRFFDTMTRLGRLVGDAVLFEFSSVSMNLNFLLQNG